MMMDLMFLCLMCVCAAEVSHALRSSPLHPSDGLCRYGWTQNCCWGWTRNSQGRCTPVCESGCKHGECVGPDQCRCHAGFTGKTCNQDVNECAFRPCKFRCMNTLGSYKCYCLNGYTMMADGTCRNARTCAMVNCQYGCAVMKGQVTCQCPSPGLRLSPDGRTCVDVDECVTGQAKCPRFRKCVNTFGSYICRCHDGYELKHINGKYHCTDKKNLFICYDKSGHKKCKCKASVDGKGYDCKTVVKVTIEPARPVEVTLSPTTITKTTGAMTTNSPKTTTRTFPVSTTTVNPATAVAMTTAPPTSTGTSATVAVTTVAPTTTGTSATVTMTTVAPTSTATSATVAMTTAPPTSTGTSATFAMTTAAPTSTVPSATVTMTTAAPTSTVTSATVAMTTAPPTSTGTSATVAMTTATPTTTATSATVAMTTATPTTTATSATVAMTTVAPTSTATSATVAMTTAAPTSTVPSATVAMTTAAPTSTVTSATVAMTTVAPTSTVPSATLAMTTAPPTSTVTSATVAMTTAAPTTTVTPAVTVAMTTAAATTTTLTTTVADTTHPPTERSPATTIPMATTAVPVATTSLTTAGSTTTLDNRIHRDTPKPRGDVHIPRYGHNLFDWDFDVELGNTAEYTRDDPGAGAVSCTFDEGLCVWMSDSGDLRWNIKEDPTGGQYLTVPDATSRRSIRGARLTLPLAPPMKAWRSSQLCLSFRHRLHGHHIGSLQVFVRKGRSHSPSVWTSTGGHGWRHTQITLWGRGLDDIVLKGERRRGKHGEIAVDDLSLRRGACAAHPP